MIVGTRGSKLALAQTSIFINALKKKFPDVSVDIKRIVTSGDKIRDRPLSALGGYGAFVKELDREILDGNIDVAVNSLKDMPVKLTEGTCLAAVLPRGPVEDVIIPPLPLEKLPPGSVVGTSSIRRKALLMSKRGDLVIKDLRGNVTTRLRKLESREYDAIVMARVGLERIGFGGHFLPLDPEEFIPAVGQGAIAVVCKKGSEYEEMLKSIEDPVTRMEVDVERFILGALGGGCSVPIGLWAKVDGNHMRVRGVVLTEFGKRLAKVDRTFAIETIPQALDSIVSELRKGMESDRR
ncbi:MAG: hydroxymethylbilane synthase [Methanomassiliicoccales archaeon]|jgi:hydroxymethylbilane synthase|nr:hydroxymethylbilane synthase [Methanomassiliicoccales archaeon]